jgi:hypothetical protein
MRARPALNGFIECSPRNPVVTGKVDQLLDVAILVVPELEGIRKIVRASHKAQENECRTEVKPVNSCSHATVLSQKW